MKRELKAFIAGTPAVIISIARPIPMKRELKDEATMQQTLESFGDRKAHPDEKGTESP